MNLIRKFIEFAMGNIIVLIIGLLSTSVISRMVLPYENGKYSIFIMVTSLIVLIVQVGMDQAYIRYYHDENSESRGEFLRKCIGIPLIINLVIGAIILILYKPISILIVDESSLFLVFLLVVHITFSIISNFALVHIRMKQRAKLYSAVTALNKIVYLMLVMLVYTLLGNNHLTLIISVTVANIVMALIAIYYEREDWLKSKSKNKVKISTKELINYGTPFIFSMAIIWIFQSIDKASLRVFADYKQIGLYAGAMNIIGMLNTLQGAFTTFWVPVAYERYSINSDDKQFFININQIVSLAMILISIGLIASKDIIVLLLGPEYREAVFIFPFLVFMPIMYTISETTVVGINFNKKTKDHIYIAIFSAVFNILGNLILVPKIGATGAAISTGLAYIIFFITRTYYANKYYKIDFKLKPFWISIVVTYILAAYSSLNTFNVQILILTLISTGIVLICYKDIIKNIFEMIKGVVKKLKSK